MGAILFIILVGVPIGEIALLIKVGKIIGFWETLAAVILTALIGTQLLRQQGLATLRKAQASLDENRFPVDEVFDGLCLLVAGALLLTPGFITDAFGLALFLPPFRAVIRTGLVRALSARGHLHVYGTGLGDGPFPNDGAGPGPGLGPGLGPVIDGEFEDLTENKTGIDGPGLPGKQEEEPGDRAVGEPPGKDASKE